MIRRNFFKKKQLLTFIFHNGFVVYYRTSSRWLSSNTLRYNVHKQIARKKFFGTPKPGRSDPCPTQLYSKYAHVEPRVHIVCISRITTYYIQKSAPVLNTHVNTRTHTVNNHQVRRRPRGGCLSDL